jgi:glycosyltransferase involved in cell wall biosynthesis
LGHHEISIPFDVDEVARNLRCEFYAGHMGQKKTRLPPHAFIRSLYYWARPFMPVVFRKILQRLRLRGRVATPFPSWPVDRTVDRLFETLMTLVIRSGGNAPVPFIWFWPDGAQAASILTHDVETKAGRDFCKTLMDLDDSFGFKSSFQVIPEERYKVTETFLETFRQRGFEINVHDLNHDGNLFRTHDEFCLRAKRINYYAKQFGAYGFRSGALYRNLRWYDAFEFSYDMSVPNVGHLDPQEGGCCTFFPYFIGNVLEIPVTVTQDYSLFHILNTYCIDLWKEQCQLILKGHGLINVIVHPDYVRGGRAQGSYRQLLQYFTDLRTRNRIWTTLPREINRWWRMRRGMELVQEGEGWRIEGEGSERAQVAYASVKDGSLVYSFDPPGDTFRPNQVPAPHIEFSQTGGLHGIEASSIVSATSHPNSFSSPERNPIVVSARDSSNAASMTTLEETPPEATRTHTPPHRPLRVAMVSYSFYELDNRVQRYASTLAKRGDHVDVFALSREGRPAEEEMEGVHVHRLQGRILNEKNQLSYAWRILQFLARATAQVAKYELKNHYDLLHIHSVPDFMVFSGLVPKLRGTPVILDIHDILPEFYASKFASGDKSGIFHMLVRVERTSCRFANHVIIANHIWRDRLISRGLCPDKCTVVMNYPDRTIFTRRDHSQSTNGRFLMLYPGSLNRHQGLDIAIRAFARISKQAPQAEFHIYGDGPSTRELMELIGDLRVESKVSMHALCPLQEMARIMESADLGIVPKRSDNFGNEAFSTKILEFMSLSVPVIVSDTMIDKYYFNDSVVRFFRSGDDNDLARCMLEMIENPAACQRQIENANRFVESLDWTAKQHEYLELVDRLAIRARP